MNVFDVNIPRDQLELLGARRLKFKQIGLDVGRAKMQDEEIVALMLAHSRATLFTRDVDFYNQKLCHTRYGIVWLDVHGSEVAEFCLRIQRHSEFDTKAKRMGRVIRAHSAGIDFWQLKTPEERHLAWKR